MNLTREDFWVLWPVLALSGIILLVVLWDAWLTEPKHKIWASYGGAFALALLTAMSFVFKVQGSAFYDVYVADAWSLFLQRAVWVLGAVALLGGADRARRVIPRRQGENAFLVLVSLLGTTLLFGAKDLVLLIVCFELMGIPLFVLAAIEKQDWAGERQSLAAEAGMKFFVLAVVSTPIALLGAGFLIGLSQTTDIRTIAQTPFTPLTAVGLILLFAGMGFKIGVVPFHMWVPDTYQAAPTPFVGYLSTVPKLAAMAALGRVYLFGYSQTQQHWVPAVIALTVVTLLMGNLWALPQSNAKRLFGYSSIGQIGYVLMAFVTVNEFGLATMLFYLVAYGITNLGALLVLEAIEVDRGGDGGISDLEGLWRRSPWLAMSMLLFLLSLAGIPFVVGFWAKLYVFIAVWRAGYAWLVVFAALIAVLALFYYLQLARAMYMADTNKNTLRTSPALAMAIGFCTLAVVGIGLYPNPLLEQANRAASGYISELPPASLE